MNAQTSIPVSVVDEGTHALMVLAAGFDTVRQRCDRLGQQFDLLSRTASVMQTEIEAHPMWTHEHLMTGDC